VQRRDDSVRVKEPDEVSIEMIIGDDEEVEETDEFP
jgi:hypothetical protein